MKKIVILSLMTMPVLSYAQSNVTLYGILDEGINYTNNQLGARNYQMTSGSVQGSRWGLKGQEVLGGRFAAVFDLENGYDVSSGKLAQGGRMFGRQAYVGISSPYGTVTLGRQYESMLDYLYPFNASQLWGGALYYHANDVDNLGGSIRFDNSVKFRSFTYNGLTFGGIYSFGGQAGEFSTDSAWSAGANYLRSNFGLGAAYTHINHPSTAIFSSSASSATYINSIFGNYLASATSQDIWGVGASYNVGAAQLLASYTDTVFRGGASGHDVRFDNYEAGLGYYVTPAVQINGSYTFTKIDNHLTSTGPHFSTFTAMADYFLSKRTDVYLQAAYQIVSGNSQVAQLEGLPASSTNKQLALRVGMRLHF